MAGDWIRLCGNLETRPEFLRLQRLVSLPEDAVIARLFRLAGWFNQHGSYGKLRHVQMDTVDSFLRSPGFADALVAVGWLRQHPGDWLTLHGFCDTSAQRKSLGVKLRAAVLSLGRCAECGATDDLVVDHIIPIARGGTGDRANLQCLCATCNRSKWKLLPSEWKAG